MGMQIIKNIKDVVKALLGCWADHVEQERAHKRRVEAMRMELEQFRDRIEMERSLKEREMGSDERKI